MSTAHPSPPAAPSAALLPASRLTSLDALRGLMMLLMGLELLKLEDVAVNFPNSAIWQWLGFHAWHVPWVGCCLHDLIHPIFAMLVGFSLAFSVASRAAQGQTRAALWRHAWWRAGLLIVLGIFVRGQGRATINWTFEDTLTQMGLGYPVLFALGFATQRTRWLSIGVILVGYWLLFACWPVLPPTPGDNIPDGWTHHFSGFYAHWNLNRNVAWEFDRWLLNLFPRPKPWIGYTGGYCTLNFIPTLANMILGLIVGTWMRARPADLMRRLVILGAAGMALGLGLHAAGVCPVVKKLWTPAWVLLSGGWSCWFMAAFYFICDVRQHQRWAFPLLVMGRNSLAMYLLFHTIDHALAELLEQYAGPALFLVLGPTLHPVLLGSAVLFLLWFILLWMHRRKLYLRV